MRRKGVAVVALALGASACVLDWDSLKPDAEAPVEAGDDAPRDAPADVLSDVLSDAPHDASFDATEKDGTHDATPTDAPEEAAVDAPADSACGFAFTGALAAWDFTSAPGNQASTPASSSAPGLTASAISRSSSLVAQLGAASINSSNWSTGALDTTRYYTITLTPPAGCALDVTSIGLDTKASGTGPTSGAVATSADGFTATSPFTPTTVANVSLAVSASTAAVEIRIYGDTAQSTQGTLRVENTMTVSGKLH